MKLLIKGGRVIDPKENIDATLDVLIQDGVVVKIQENIEEDTDKTIDATNKWVVPGLIDVHVHLREPGFVHKEDIETGSCAAAVGGFTTVCCMPNTNPTIDNVEVIEYIKDRASLINILPVGAITKGLNGKELTNMKEMLDAGICAVSDDGKSVMNSKILKKAMEEAARLNIPMMSHCEDMNLAGGSMNKGKISEKLGIKGIGNEAEDVITARDIILAKHTGVKLHLCHVSTKLSTQLIRFAKSIGVDITAETAPHYFTLTEDMVEIEGTNAKMSPPLRTKEDMEAIKRAIIDNTIEIIATDHAPHHKDEKDVEFEKAPFGIVGLETSFAISNTELVETGLLTPMELIEKMSTNPAKLLGIDKGTLGAGKVADIAIIDPNKECVIDKNKLVSKGKNTPFHNKKVKGIVEYTIVDGYVIYENREELK